jgi:hypothetical protein
VIGANIQPILIVTGAITASMLLQYVAPQPVLRLVYGADAPTEPVALLLARQWGLLVFCIGALLIYAAFHAEMRAPVMVAAVVEKVALAVALLSPAMRNRGMARMVALGDLAMALIYVLYLVGF